MNVETTASVPRKPITGHTVLYWLLGFFGVIFSANAVFIWLALGSFPGVAVESSYQAGLAYNEEIARAKAQKSRHWGVEATVSRHGGGAADIVVVAQDGEGTPLSGLAFNATLTRPVSSETGHAVVLTETETGRYIGTVHELPDGQWILDLAAEDAQGVVFRSQNRLFLKGE